VVVARYRTLVSDAARCQLIRRPSYAGLLLVIVAPGLFIENCSQGFRDQPLRLNSAD
jgi:hypothetical protein